VFKNNYTNKPNTFCVEAILKIAKIVVSKYVARGVIPYREKEDVEMAVVEKFLNQQEKIMNAFEGKSKISTYYAAIINKMCCEVIRKESKHWYSLSENDPQEIANSNATADFDTDKKTCLNSEIHLLSKALLFFNGDAGKVNLFLKYYFDIEIKDEDIKTFSLEHYGKIKEILACEKEALKAAKFEKMADVVNVVEKKNIKGDAVRMWLNKQIDVLLKRINYHGNSKHTVETLCILMEMKSLN